jgi:uncharacterized damage-inducible protein DinB
MIIESLQIVFTRYLQQLKEEIALYQQESNLWKIGGQIKNSAGNLCLHLIGNLNTYIGKELGGTNYVRNREAEFALKDVPRAELLRMIEETIIVVNASLGKLDPATLKDEFPVLVWEQKTTTEYLLIHLVAHLGYHLGQISYHRRYFDQLPVAS